MTDIELSVTGEQLMLLRSASFMYSLWHLEDGARRVRTDADAEAAAQLMRTIVTKTNEFFVTAGLNFGVNVTNVTSYRGTLFVDHATLSTLLTATRYCLKEFEGDGGWIDFCVASPGALGVYGITYDDLQQLEVFLRAAADHGR